MMRPALAGRLSRFLVGCHPRRWRDRYADEMLDVLDQHHPTTRTVTSLGASAVSAHLDPAYRTGHLSLARLRRTALISAAIAAPLALVLAPVGYQIWQDGYWHPATDNGLSAVVFSAHSPILVTAYGGALDGTDVVWDISDLSRPRRLSWFEGGGPTALSPDGRTVATVTFGRQTALWNVANLRHPAKMATLPTTDGNTLWGQTFSPDGRILATGYYDGIALWDVTSPARPRLLRSLNATLTFTTGHAVSEGDTPLGPQAIAFSPDGSTLASVVGNDQIALWNVSDPAHAYRMATLAGAGDSIMDFAFSPGGNLLAAVTYHHGTVLVYNLADPTRPARTATVRGMLTRALYPNGTPRPTQVPLCPTCGPANYAVAFTPGGHTLTVVVDRSEMTASTGRDTIFDWPVTGSGALGAVTTVARDAADFQPFITPGDRTVLGGGSSHAWRVWPLP